jgi:hypothetical protein
MCDVALAKGLARDADADATKTELGADAEAREIACMRGPNAACVGARTRASAPACAACVAVSAAGSTRLDANLIYAVAVYASFAFGRAEQIAVGAIWRDFRQLSNTASKEKWTDHKHVDPEFFGILWKFYEEIELKRAGIPLR